MNQARALDYLLAGRALNFIFVVLDVVVVHPERERAQNLPLRAIFRDPNPGDIHGFGRGAHQRLQEFLSSFGGCALKEVAYQGFGI